MEFAVYPNKEGNMTDEELLKAWDNAFAEPVYFDHTPTADDILILRLRYVIKKAQEVT